jgi:hypothetical protein
MLALISRGGDKAGACDRGIDVAGYAGRATASNFYNGAARIFPRHQKKTKPSMVAHSYKLAVLIHGRTWG